MEGLITINASGTRYTTKISTLRLGAPEGSILWDVATRKREREDEEIFVDRDGALFGHILNAVRNRKVYTNRALGLNEEIWADELAYFGLEKKKPLVAESDAVRNIVESISAEKQRENAKILETVKHMFTWFLNQRPKRKFLIKNGPSMYEGFPVDADSFIRANETMMRSFAGDRRIYFHVN